MIAVRLLAAGTIVREAVVRHGTFLIGRGPENDLVIADPSVSRQHARVRIDENGTAWIEDANSRHGVRVGGAPVERVAVPPGTSLRCELGAVQVELAALSQDATVELPVSDVTAVRAAGPRRALEAFAYWVANIAGTVALMAVSPAFWSPWEQGRASKVAWAALATAVGVLVAVFLLMGLLRIVGRRVRLTDAMRAFALVSWGWVLVTVGLHAASYGLSVSAHGLVADVIVSAVVAASLAYLASVARPGSRRKFFLAWLAAAGLFLAASQAVGQLTARQAGTPAVDYDVSSPVAGVTGPATDLDPYLESVRASFKTAAQRAAEERGRSDAIN